MKRKIATITLIAILTISTVFADSASNNAPAISVGLTTGFEQDILMYDRTSINNEQIPIKATALFDITNDFAMKANLGMAISIIDERNFSETRIGFATDVLAYYVLSLPDSLNLYFGGGLGYDYVKLMDTNIANIKGKSSMHTIDLILEMLTTYEIAENVSLTAGMNLGFDGLKTLTSAKSRQSLLGDAFGMQCGFNLGGTYKFY